MKKRHGGGLAEGSRKRSRVDDEDSNAGTEISVEAVE